MNPAQQVSPLHKAVAGRVELSPAGRNWRGRGFDGTTEHRLCRHGLVRLRHTGRGAQADTLIAHGSTTNRDADWKDMIRMVSWTGSSREAIANIARRHGFGEAAGAAMAEAIAHSGGAMAQFHHPELGGMGQWSRGGMLMIGDMFNDGLKGRVRALADELSAALHQGTLTFDPARTTGAFGHWWPEALGTPSSTGAQNGRRYAVFPEKRRLAIETDDRVRLYDTGEHRIGGASQQQGTATTLSFGSDRGTVGLDDFSEVAREAATAPRPIEPNARETSAPGKNAPEKSAPAPSAAPSAGLRTQAQTLPLAMAESGHQTETETPRSSTMPAAAPGDPIVLLQRLAELKSAGILSDEEFAAKKAELLARI